MQKQTYQTSIEKKIHRKIIGAGISNDTNHDNPDEDIVLEVTCYKNPIKIYQFVVSENLKSNVRAELINLMFELDNYDGSTSQISKICAILGVEKHVNFNNKVEIEGGKSLKLTAQLSFDNDTDFKSIDKNEKITSDNAARLLREELSKPPNVLFEELIMHYNVKFPIYIVLLQYQKFIIKTIDTICKAQKCDSIFQLEKKYNTTFRFKKLKSSDINIEKFLDICNIDLEAVFQKVLNKKITTPSIKEFSFTPRLPNYRTNIIKTDGIKELAKKIMDIRLKFVPELLEIELAYIDFAIDFAKITKKIYTDFSCY